MEHQDQGHILAVLKELQNSSETCLYSDLKILIKINQEPYLLNVYLVYGNMQNFWVVLSFNVKTTKGQIQGTGALGYDISLLNPEVAGTRYYAI